MMQAEDTGAIQARGPPGPCQEPRHHLNLRILY